MSQNVFGQQAAAVAEAALRVRYNGSFAYASFTAASTSGTLVVSLGVSDTSLAAAVSAMETVFTSSANTDRVNHIKDLIRWWKTTTSGAEVKSGDFECEVLHALGNSVVDAPHHATVDLFEDDAGTTNNLRGEWREVLLWDNDATGVYGVHLRLPHPKTSKNGVTIDSIVGDLTGTDLAALDNGMIRIIYDDDGNALWSSGAQTTNGLANYNIIAGARGGPVSFNKPVVIYDRAAVAGDAADVDATSMVVRYDVVRLPM